VVFNVTAKISKKRNSATKQIHQTSKLQLQQHMGHLLNYKKLKNCKK